MDLKQEIYSQWEQNIMSNNVFSPQIRHAARNNGAFGVAAKQENNKSGLQSEKKDTVRDTPGAGNNNDEEKDNNGKEGPLDEALRRLGR